jgi:hypothetical protein
MQGIQPGGDRHINALIIVLKRALDLMPVEPMPGLLSQFGRLRALIRVRLIMMTSGTRDSSPPDRLLEVTEAATRLGVSTDDLFRDTEQSIVQ